jgi:hypothetical protein
MAASTYGESASSDLRTSPGDRGGADVLVRLEVAGLRLTGSSDLVRRRGSGLEHGGDEKYYYERHMPVSWRKPRAILIVRRAKYITAISGRVTSEAVVPVRRGVAAGG